MRCALLLLLFVNSAWSGSILNYDYEADSNLQNANSSQCSDRRNNSTGDIARITSKFKTFLDGKIHSCINSSAKQEHFKCLEVELEFKNNVLNCRKGGENKASAVYDCFNKFEKGANEKLKALSCPYSSVTHISLHNARSLTGPELALHVPLMETFRNLILVQKMDQEKCLNPIKKIIKKCIEGSIVV